MVTESTFFTIIVPVIRAEYLAAALKSVLEQDFSDWELIVINDASTDLISEVVDEFLVDKRFQYVENNFNIGSKSPACVWNQGLALAKGQFTLILGDDDYYGQGVLKQFYTLSQQHPNANLLRTRLCVVSAEDRIIHCAPRLPKWSPWWDLLYSRSGYFHHPLSICEHAFLTAKLRNVGGFWELPKAWGSDEATVLKLALDGGCASTNDAWAYWRNDGRNISSQPLSPQKSLTLQELYSWQEKFILENADSIHDFSCEELLRVVKERGIEARNEYLYLVQQKSLRYKIKSSLRNLLSLCSRWL